MSEANGSKTNGKVTCKNCGWFTDKVEDDDLTWPSEFYKGRGWIRLEGFCVLHHADLFVTTACGAWLPNTLIKGALPHG